MNERIRLLAKQATLKWAEEVPGGVQEMEFFDKEKFAELIVRECAKVAVFKDSGTVATAEAAGHMAAGRSIAARMINEHFGVEE